MTIVEIGAIGEMVGATAVVVSLVYLAIQMRQNTHAVRAQILENITSGYVAVAGLILPQATEFAKGVAAEDDFSAMHPTEVMVFFSAIFAMFKHFERMFALHRNGFIDDEAWAAWHEHISMYFHQPGVQLWWPLRRKSFTEPFQQFLESSPAPDDIIGIAELMHRSTAGA